MNLVKYRTLLSWNHIVCWANCWPHYQARLHCQRHDVLSFCFQVLNQCAAYQTRHIDRQIAYISGKRNDDSQACLHRIFATAN